VLIGETSGLRQRINEYGTGTQENGNKRWREEFLTKGDIYLYILGFAQETLRGTDGTSVTLRISDLTSGNERVVLEQLLILRERAREDDSRVLVNRKI
jgi:hypothetical protein